MRLGITFYLAVAGLLITLALLIKAGERPVVPTATRNYEAELEECVSYLGKCAQIVENDCRPRKESL